MSSDEDFDQWLPPDVSPPSQSPSAAKSRDRLARNAPVQLVSPAANSDRLINTYRDYASELTEGIRAAYGNGPPDPDDVAQEAFHRVYQRGEQFCDVANTPEIQVGSYTLVNARAGFRLENWQFGFFANNLLDERFITEKNFVAADPGTGTVNVAGNAQVRVNQPRVAGVSIEYQF
ncbi:MAG: hypothetical protein AAGH76_11185 [Pseudomonadota bacterium]